MRFDLELVESISFSHAKSSERKNEDAILPAVVTKNAIFIALADGVGGSEGGEVASSIAISTVSKQILEDPDSKLEELFNNVSKKLNFESKNRINHENMATTLIICKITLGKVEVASVGDSRAYVIKGNSAYKLTTDHTKKQELIDSGVFKKSELKGHYSESQLTNSLRANRTFKLDIKTYKYNCGSILLMSDGVYRAFDGTRIVGNNGQDNLLQVCSNIKKRILKKGPKDDYSLVAVRFKNALQDNQIE